MRTPASLIFDFLERHPSFSIERYEISMGVFDALRRSIRSIVVGLHDDGDQEACETADRLRSSLSEWLTVPVPFDGMILTTLQTFGSPADMEARWGREIRTAFDSALRAAQAIQLVENPLREKLRTVIHELDATGLSFKIYCHRTARVHFESLLPQHANPLFGEATFLHSVSDYRDSDTFDALIKVGPLRSWGWGSAPDAIKAAPRFDRLIQVVWFGCADELGFGYDPVAPHADETGVSASPVANDASLDARISWKQHVTPSGDNDGAPREYAPQEDEFRIFESLNQPGQKRRATLVRIDGEQGILYPPHSQILSFDPALSATVPVKHRLPGETLLPGMFVILPRHDDLDLGSSQTQAGLFSSVWKSRLAAEYLADSYGLVRRLTAGGIRLLDLYSSVERWSRSSSGVLPAPGDRRHFQILIQVLGIGLEGANPAGAEGIPWWQRAWNEIRRARGDAIQTGKHEQQLVDEELLEILDGLLPAIRSEASTKEAFPLVIPADRTLHGNISFYKVLSMEEGFLTPDTELNVVRELNTIYQWRA